MQSAGAERWCRARVQSAHQLVLLLHLGDLLGVLLVHLLQLGHQCLAPLAQGLLIVDQLPGKRMVRPQNAQQEEQAPSQRDRISSQQAQQEKA